MEEYPYKVTKSDGQQVPAGKGILQAPEKGGA